MYMENSWGHDKTEINELCAFRIDLPCYPSIWSERLTLELELMVLIDTVPFVITSDDQGS